MKHDRTLQNKEQACYSMAQWVISRQMGEAFSAERVQRFEKQPRVRGERRRKSSPRQRVAVGADVYFTQREFQVAKLLLCTKTIKEVADKMQLSLRTVEFYVHNMRAKLKARNKAALVAMLSTLEVLRA